MSNSNDRRPINMCDFRTDNPPLLDPHSEFETKVEHYADKGWDAESITNALHRTTTMLDGYNSRFAIAAKSPSWKRLYSRVCKAMGVDELAD